MKRTVTKLDTDTFPDVIQRYLKNAVIYDSSCSNTAKVYFIDKDGGFFLKTAPKGALAFEEQMTQYFNRIGLGAKVEQYISDECDMMITRRIAGEDCTYADYLASPCQLCDTLAMIHHMLHSADTTDCPVKNKTADYISYAKKRYKNGYFDNSLVKDKSGVENADRVMAMLDKYCGLLKNDCLVHGDFCLPNVILDNWNFSGFIDVDHAGVGDRHIDVFWTLWSLTYNLKTDKYTDRFLDAYGKDKIDSKALKAVLYAEMFG